MGKHRDSVGLRLPDEGVSNDENTADSEEPSEEEGPDEEDFYMKKNQMKKIHVKQNQVKTFHCEEEPNEEISCEGEEDFCESPDEEACGGELDEVPCEEERCEEGPSEVEPSEKELSELSEEDPSEAEPSEGSAAQLSYNSDNDGDSVQANPTKKRMSADEMSDAKKTGSSDIDLLGQSKNLSNYLGVSAKLELEITESSGKKRRSRWDVQAGACGLAEDGGDVATNKKKTRWSNDDCQLNAAVPIKSPDFVKGLVTAVYTDPEILKLNSQLLEITKKLQAREVVDERPEFKRSPSPAPIYDNLGIRVNTREVRLRAKLMLERKIIVSKLAQKNSKFKPPDCKNPIQKNSKFKSPEYKNLKLYKKLYIPLKEYPGYNFIGLIIGPRGNTLKRMEKETGAKIKLRGPGSIKVRKSKQNKLYPSDNEDLHVLVEADSQASLDAAVNMVEKLLIPVEDGKNAHKAAQLRELSVLTRTLRDRKSSNLRKMDPCNLCGHAGHQTSACPLTASTPGTKTNGQQVNFLAELGRDLSSFRGCQVPSATVPSLACSAIGPFSPPNSKRKKEIDNANLFVGYLPNSLNEDRLIELFLPFGRICQAKVMRDEHTGLSKGCGFVRYTDSINAAKAVAQMNGYRIDGKRLAVRVAGSPLPSLNMNEAAGGLRSFSQLPKYPGPEAISHNNPGPMCWPGPPGSMLPEPVASFPENSSFFICTNTFSGQSSTSLDPLCQTSVSSSLFSCDSELAQFPGYLKSLDPPH